MTSKQRGSPHFISFRKNNIEELRKRLKNKPLEKHRKILALFAYDKSLSRAKVDEYYQILKDGELI